MAEENNEENNQVPMTDDEAAEDLKRRAKALQEREREYNSTLKQMENLTKDFAKQFCEDAKAIFEKNLEIAEANVQIFNEVRGEIERLCGVGEWDGAVELIQRMIRTQPDDAKFLVDEEDFYLKSVRENNIEEVKTMLDEVHAKL